MSRAAHARYFAPPPEPDGGRKALVGLDRAELETEITALGEPAFRARQLWHWIYHRGVTDFDLMTSLSKAFRARLAEHYVVGRPGVGTALTAMVRGKPVPVEVSKLPVVPHRYRR